MPKNLWHLLSLFVLWYQFELHAQLNTYYTDGVDKGVISDNHIVSVEEFIKDSFMSNGSFDPYKIQKFIERLKNEKRKLASDLTETKILEDIELYVKKPSKAIAKRTGEEAVNKKDLIIGYNKYLIPKIEKLLKAVISGESENICIGLIHDFIRGYVSYYVPNAERTIFPYDVNFVRAGVHVLKRFNFKKDASKTESINLRVDSSNLGEVNSCLKVNVHVGHYLRHDEITELKNCHFDLSKLNPGVSALWHQKTTEDIKAQKEAYEKYYPREGETVYYNKIIYRGAGSPKVNIYFIRDGKKIKAKLKLGPEIHTEIVVSELMRLCGLNQDQMKYQKSVKLHLGKTSYKEFISQLANKNGIEHVNRFIWGHGGEKGNEWILIKDFLYEIRPEEELRTANIDFSSWDLQDRREFRALILLWGWLGVNDTKVENFKFIFKKKKNNELIPLYRLQDTGVALGSQTFVRKPRDIIELYNYYKVNIFPKSFIKSKPKKNKIKIIWNDFALSGKIFKSTSWYDLKWMARIICKIKKEDIYRVLISSGMPEPVADIYYFKFLSRRNDLIDAFHLQEDCIKDDIPELKKYNKLDSDGNYIIKKGKVVQRTFDGKNDVVQVGEKWLTFIPAKLKDFTLPNNFWSEKKGYHNSSVKHKAPFGVKINSQIDQYEKDKAFFKIPIGIGIQVLISREVRPSSQLINLNGSTHQYSIKDILKIRFYGSSPLFNKLVSKLKDFTFSFNLSFFEKEYTHIHFADTVKKAYLKKFSLFKIIFNLKSYAAQKLEPMSVIKTYLNYGLDLSLNVEFNPLKAFIANSTGIGFKVKKYLTNHYTRDQFGQLNIIKESSIKKEVAANLKLLEINTYEAKLPLFNLGFGVGRFKMKFDSYLIPRDDTLRDGTDAYLSNELKQEQKKQLKRGLKNNEVFINDYHVETKGKFTNTALGALFVFNREKSKMSALTKVTDNNSFDKKFYRYTIQKERSLGATNLTIDFGTTEILTKNRKRMEVVAESDLDQVDKTVYAIRVIDYYRVRKRNKIISLINDLNRRYSKNQDLDFYRDYELPEKMASDKFRKIYANTRILISGKHLHRKILTLTQPELKTRLKEHYNSLPKRRFQKLVSSYHIKKNFKKILNLDLVKLKSNTKKIKYFSKILYHLKPEIYGVKFLSALIPLKGIFVMGSISGIIRNFSTLQSLQQQQKRRFTGKSWGVLKIKAPLQYFMRNHRYVPVSNYIRKSMKDQEYLGTLQVGVPKNIDMTYDKNGMF